MNSTDQRAILEEVRSYVREGRLDKALDASHRPVGQPDPTTGGVALQPVAAYASDRRPDCKVVAGGAML